MSTYLIPYKFFDPPIVLDCSVTPIPASGSSTLQVIADTGIVTGIGITFHDNTGAMIGVYVGATLVTVIGSGVSNVGWCKIPPHSAISLRNMANVAIPSGTLQAALVTL